MKKATTTTKKPARAPLAAANVNTIITNSLAPVAGTILPPKPILPPTKAILPPNNILPPNPAPAQKRKADEVEPEAEAEADGESDDDDMRYPVTENCDQIRRKINSFLQTGEMKVGKFQEALGVNSRGFNTFLRQTGSDKGSCSNTYYAASKFFKKREAKGIKVPKKRVKKGEEKDLDVSAIKLAGEDEVDVEVYDTCDEVRRKISALLREPGVTQAAFLRAIATTYPEPRKMQPKMLNDFLGKKGASAGNTSSVFYASYVFFEKLRIRDRKPKSKHRLDMEGEHRDGFDTKHRHESYIVPIGTNVYEDNLGKIHCSRY